MLGPQVWPAMERALASGAWGEEHVAAVAKAVARHPSRAGRETIAALQQHAWDTFDAQNLANVAWAFAKLDYGASGPGRALWRRLAGQARPRLVAFAPQGAANMLWALATVRHTDPALLAAAAGALEERLAAELQPQGVANILWASPRIL